MIKVKTDGDNFASLEHERVRVELSKDGDSPQCPRSWTWGIWIDGEMVSGTSEETSLATSVKDVKEEIDAMIAELSVMSDYLKAYEVFGKEPEVSEQPRHVRPFVDNPATDRHFMWR